MEIYRGKFTWEMHYGYTAIMCFIEKFPIEKDQMRTFKQPFTDGISVERYKDESIYTIDYCWSYDKEKVMDWLREKRDLAIRERKEQMERELEILEDSRIIDGTHED